MKMLAGGIDVFYIDESHDSNLYVVTCLAIPLIRPTDSGIDIAWSGHFDLFKRWRKDMATALYVPRNKELHGVKLASGRGRYYKNKHNLDRARASGLYRKILRSLTFLPDASIMSASAERNKHLYGNERLEAALYALFQRMRSQCAARGVNAIVFFDQGHPEYRKLFRQAQIYLPTGSQVGRWPTGGAAKNMPLDMFFKDGSEKQSKHCYFTQVADLIAYAAFLKRKHELSQLTAWQAQYRLGTLYDEIPAQKINLRAYRPAPADGIVRL